jgi:membrane associated rhomboid family serine protease
MNILIYLIIGVTVLISAQGFKDRMFFEKYMLRVGSVLNGKEYIRTISSGFLHADWMHLIFNMVTLYFFGPEVLFATGIGPFLAIYFGSMAFGSLASLYFNLNNPYYSAIGASGAVSGIVFSAIIIHPSMSLFIIPIPFPIPGWLFGIGYVIYSIYGMKKNLGNIGHSAHLGGGIAGMIISISLFPSLLEQSWMTILLISLPIAGILVYEKFK